MYIYVLVACMLFVHACTFYLHQTISVKDENIPAKVLLHTLAFCIPSVYKLHMHLSILVGGANTLGCISSLVGH